MKYQVISRDYNGTTLILFTTDNLLSAVNRIKKEVTDVNFENALTTADKFKSIEAFYPIISSKLGEERKDIVYAGKFTDGSHKAYFFNEDQSPELKNIADNSILFYIGKNEDKEYFLQDKKGNNISSFNHEDLNEKTYYYIKVLTK